MTTSASKPANDDRALYGTESINYPRGGELEETVFLRNSRYPYLNFFLNWHSTRTCKFTVNSHNWDANSRKEYVTFLSVKEMQWLVEILTYMLGRMEGSTPSAGSGSKKGEDL